MRMVSERLAVVSPWPKFYTHPVHTGIYSYLYSYRYQLYFLRYPETGLPAVII